MIRSARIEAFTDSLYNGGQGDRPMVYQFQELERKLAAFPPPSRRNGLDILPLFHCLHFLSTSDYCSGEERKKEDHTVSRSF